MKRSFSNWITGLARHFRRPATASRPWRARPRVEALEDRWCPSCIVFGGTSPGSTLYIFGDNTSNQVTINQDDNANSLVVACDGGAPEPFLSSNVGRLYVSLQGSGDDFEWNLLGTVGLRFGGKQANILLGDGIDHAELWFNGGGIGGDMSLRGSSTITVDGGAQDDTVWANFGRKHGGMLSYTVNLGAGNDEATAHLWGDLTGGTEVRFELNGNDGEDNLWTWNTYDNVAAAYNSIDITGDSSLELVLNGGNHDDSLRAEYSGEMDGDLVLRMDGQNGDDYVTADLYMQGTSSGSVDGTVKGGADDDYLYFKLYEAASSNITIVNALLDGGTGYDTRHRFRTTPNVTVINCEAMDPAFGTWP